MPPAMTVRRASVVRQGVPILHRAPRSGDDASRHASRQLTVDCDPQDQARGRSRLRQPGRGHRARPGRLSPARHRRRPRSRQMDHPSATPYPRPGAHWDMSPRCRWRAVPVTVPEPRAISGTRNARGPGQSACRALTDVRRSFDARSHRSLRCGRGRSTSCGPEQRGTAAPSRRSSGPVPPSQQRCCGGGVDPLD